MSMTVKHPLNYWKSVLLLCTCFVVTQHSWSQQVKVQAGFLPDSVKLGEEIAFYLTANYPSELQVLFPDSTFDFTPFEYGTKKYFATRSSNGSSYDSTIYFLSTFETDRAQFLSMPVYAVADGDSTMYFSNEDSVKLIELVKAIPDSVAIEKLPLLTNTAYHKVSLQFNYVLALIVAGILLIVLIVIWLIYGKRIRRHFQAKRLLKKHQDFIDAYNGVLKQVQQAFSSQQTENALSLWKKYMEQLESRPYTKLTTPETVMLQKDETLGKNLRNIDNAIYGYSTNIMESLQHLKIFADDRFNKKLQEVKHGK